MNWEMYFKHITTECGYWKLRSTGLAWELFPDFPASWEEHLKELSLWEANREED